MTERWKAIPGWDDLYEVSNMGRVRSLPRVVPHPTNKSGQQKVRGSMLTPLINKAGYPTVMLSYEGKPQRQYVHALVLSAFRGPPPEGQVCRHRDGNPSRSVLSNLTYGTQSQNMKDAVRHGSLAPGLNHHTSILTVHQVRRIRKLRKAGWLIREIMADMDLRFAVVRCCANGSTYQDVA